MKFIEKNNTNDDIIRRICENRNVDYDNLQEFLNPCKDNIMNPLVYKNMKKGAEMILSRVKSGLPIGILVDPDADGYCSSAMLINYLMETFDFKNFIIYMHEDKTHGLSENIVGKILLDKPSLMVTPDSSSLDFDSHKILYQNGIDLLVIDHHDCNGYSDFATIINTQLVENGNKTLSGGGMVLKLLELLDILTGNDNAENYYDLASVSLVADCMDMTHLETRYYVQKGIRNLQNPLLVELCRAESEKDYETISFEIAPTINAFTRVGTMEEKLDLFWAMTGCSYQREITLRGQGKFSLPVAEYIAKMSSRIKSRQNTQINKALDSEETEIVSENLPFTVCLLTEKANRTLTGLIGNRMVERFRKPAIVIKKVSETEFKGSGRTTETFPNFKSYLKEFNVFNYCAGHEGAFGVSIDDKNLNKLFELIRNKNLGENSDAYIVDKAYIGRVSAFDILAVSELNNFYSKGFEKPLFFIEHDISPNELDIIGQKRNTIRIKHDNVTYVKFRCSEDEIEKVKRISATRIKIVGTFETNEYNDRLYPQVIIEDYELEGEEKQIGFGSDLAFGFGAINW